MKNPGKIFEEDFKNSCPDNIWIEREKDNIGNFEKDNKNIRFTMSSDYDFRIFNGNKLYLIELKSTKGKSLPYSRFKKTYKYDQLKKLHSFVCYDNILAGVVINFRDIEKTYYIDINKLIMCKESGMRESLSIDEAEHHGVLIKQELKRVRYKYDFSFFGG